MPEITSNNHSNALQKKLELPIALTNYADVASNCYCVDKTLFIKDLLDYSSMVTLFTRPRHFGKTLNMSMLKTFFEKTDKDTSIYFKDKKIWAEGERYTSHQGKYPVIFLTFAGLELKTWQSALENIKKLLQAEFLRHSEILKSPKVSSIDLEYFNEVVQQKTDGTELDCALLMLSRMIHECCGTRPIIILDAYDVPVQQGYLNGFYSEARSFMGNFCSGGLKDNSSLEFGVLTGILHLAEESIFSGFNNLVVDSVLNRRFNEYFGFTYDEVKAITKYYGAEEKYAEICEWWGGYNFGGTLLCNPQAVMNYFSNGCKASACWVPALNNDIVESVIPKTDEYDCERFIKLLNGEATRKHIDTSIVYRKLDERPDLLYSILVALGCLTTGGEPIDPDRYDYYELTIPNKELARVCRNEILRCFSRLFTPDNSMAMFTALTNGDAASLKELLQQLLIESVSLYDTANKNFCYRLMLGLCAFFNGYYTTTNSDSLNKDFFDIQLMPKKANLPGILIELKAGKDPSEEALQQLAKEALKQIDEKKHDAEMVSKGIKPILKYGLAFCGRTAKGCFKLGRKAQPEAELILE